MKVRLSDIGPEGLTINDTLPLEALTVRMAEGRGNDIVFVAAPNVAIKVFRTAGGGYTEGSASTVVRQPCGRCLEQKEQTLTVPIHFLITTKDSGKGEDVAESVVYCDGDIVELQDAIFEEFILALSLHWSPEVDAEGKCLGCNKDSKVKESAKQEGSAKGVKLGDLFKKINIQ